MSNLKYKSLLIITYGRSGSTLLQGVLNSIDGCLIRGENANFCFECFRAYRAIKTTNRFYGSDETEPWYGSKNWKVESYIEEVRKYVRESIWGDKNPHSVNCYGFKEIRYTPREIPKYFNEYLDFLRRIFPDCAFVFNTRNLDDTSRSAWWRKEEPDAIKKLLRQTETRFFDYISNNPEHSFHIDFSDVLANGNRLFELFQFLGAEYDRKRISEVLSVRHSYTPDD